MRRQEVVTGVAAVVLIVAWNGWYLWGWNGPNGEESIEPKLWRDIKKTSLVENADGGVTPQFDESVAATDGTRVELPGVGFVLASGVRENEEGDREVTEFLLLPAEEGVAWCCGLAAMPRTEFSVLVECPNAPFPVSKVDRKSSAVFVNVEGVLRLEKENSLGALYTLEDVAIEFVDVEDVMPPNVRNRCLNQPMLPWLNEQRKRPESSPSST